MKIDIFSLLLTLGTTAISIWLSLYLFLHDIPKKLDFLIKKEKNQLTYHQALSLADLYVFHLQTVIKKKVERYIDKYLASNIEPSQFSTAQEFIDKVTDDTIEDVKDKFEKFELYGGSSFSDLIKEMLQEKNSVTEITKQNALKLFKKCAEENLCGEPLKAKFIILINKSGKASTSRIRNRIKKIYNIKDE